MLPVLSSALLFLLLYGRVQTRLLMLGSLTAAALLFLAGHLFGHSHGAFLSIDAWAQRSGLRRWNSGLKLAAVLICEVVCVGSASPLPAIYLLAAAAFFTLVLGRIPARLYFSLLLAPVWFILLGCLALVVEVGPEPIGFPLFSSGGWYICVTPQGQRLAAYTLLKAMGAVSCLYLLSLSTPVYRIIACLRRVKIPDVAAELAYLIYRYLFILLETHSQMVYASASRLGYRGVGTSLKTTGRNAFALLFVSFRRTSDMLAAMEARCYDGRISFLCRTEPVSRGQLCWTAALFSGLALALYAGGGG